jgi:hypothetical protein
MMALFVLRHFHKNGNCGISHCQGNFPSGHGSRLAAYEDGVLKTFFLPLCLLLFINYQLQPQPPIYNNHTHSTPSNQSTTLPKCLPQTLTSQMRASSARPLTQSRTPPTTSLSPFRATLLRPAKRPTSVRSHHHLTICSPLRNANNVPQSKQRATSVTPP